jgi:hypothetical protein
VAALDLRAAVPDVPIVIESPALSDSPPVTIGME